MHGKPRTLTKIIAVDAWLVRYVPLLLFLLSTAIAFNPAAILAEDIGVTRKVVKLAIARSINKRLSSGDGLTFNEIVHTGRASAIEIELNDESRLTLGENAEIILDSMISEPNRGIVKGTFRMLTGVLRFKSAQAKLDLLINTPTGTIGIRGTEFDLLATTMATEIVMLEGVVEVASAAGTATVSSGQTYRMSGSTAVFLDAPTPEMREASSRMMALITGPENAPSSSTSSRTSPALPTPHDQSNVASSSNRLIMELASGPVVIEMHPDLAPKNVAHMKRLIYSGAFNGLVFQFVRPGYVAETATPVNVNTEVPTELSTTPFERGTVGMSHDPKAPNSAKGKFFIALRRAKVLDGRYTVWGRVVSGMEHLEKLPATTGTRAREMIKSLQVVN